MKTLHYGILESFKTGRKNQTIYRPYKDFFLFLKYDSDGELYEMSLVKTLNSKPNSQNMTFYFMPQNNMVTFKSPSSLSGRCWSSGYVSWGSVYDDDGDDKGSSTYTKIDLSQWINDCVDMMYDLLKTEN